MTLPTTLRHTDPPDKESNFSWLSHHPRTGLLVMCHVSLAHFPLAHFPLSHFSLSTAQSHSFLLLSLLTLLSFAE